MIFSDFFVLLSDFFSNFLSSIPAFSFTNPFWVLLLSIVAFFVFRSFIRLFFSDRNGDCANCCRFDCEGKACWYHHRRNKH